MIEGDRIRFRGVEREDLAIFVEWLSDPEVRNGLSMHLPMSNAREENWFEDMLKRPIDEHPLLIEAQIEENWQRIGNLGLFSIDWRLGEAEVGIMIGAKEHWNKGYGTEAMLLLLRHAFETLNLHRVFLRVFENNLGAIRSYEKAGFVHEGRLRDANFQDGEYKDVLMMSILEPEWKAAQ